MSLNHSQQMIWDVGLLTASAMIAAATGLTRQLPPNNSSSNGTETKDYVEYREELRKNLLINYDRSRVPQRSLAQPINLSLYMWPYDILYVHEAEGSIKISGWFDMYWLDRNLTWDPADYGGIENVFIEASEIWLPGIDIFYSKEDSPRTQTCGSGCYVRVDSRGNVLRGIYFAYSFPCRFNVKYFPFDEQSCELEVANWYLDNSIMDLWPANKEVDMSVFLANEEWHLVNISVSRKVTFYNYGWFPSIVYRISLVRKPFYYICNLISPSVIICVAAVIGFHMPSMGTGIHVEKVKMGLTAILSIFILQLGISDKMPRTSDVIPLINIFYFFLVLILSLAILVTSLIILIEKEGMKGRPVPPFLRKLFLRGVPSVPKRGKTVSKLNFSTIHILEKNNGPANSEKENLLISSESRLAGVYFDALSPPLPPKTEKMVDGKLAACLQELALGSAEIRVHIRMQQEREVIRWEWTKLADAAERCSMFGFLLAILSSCLLFAYHDWY